jgi:hypothetical protein
MLTPKREAFAAGLAAGMTQAAAYRQAFPKSLQWKDATVWRKASLLAGNGEVQARVCDLQVQTADAALVTRVEHVAELARLRRLAEVGGQYAAAIKAEELRGKVCGLYVEKLEHTGKGGGPIEARVRDLTDEELAAELERYGIKR